MNITEKKTWIPFTTCTGLKAKYIIDGEDLSYDVRIKILTPMPRSFYYSARNEAGIYYDENILPSLIVKP